MRASGRRNSLARRIWTAVSRTLLSISAHLNEFSSARTSASSRSPIPALASTSISTTRLMYVSQSGKLSRNASRFSLRLSVSISTLLSRKKRFLSISVPVSLGRIRVPGVAVIPFIPHGVYVLKVVCPGIVFPRAVGTAQGAAESRIIDLTLGLRGNRFTGHLIFGLSALSERKLNKHPRPARRNFIGNFKCQLAAGRYLYGLFNGHGVTIA